MKTYAAFRTEDMLSSKAYEVALRGPEFSSSGLELKIAKGGTVLRSWQLPPSSSSKKLKHAMETAALQYYWEHPGKTMNNGRPGYDAYLTLASLYRDLVDVSLGDWMEARNYEYELEAEATFRNRTIPVVLTCVCDGAWFRITARFQLSTARHVRNDLVLTRDYSSAMTTTLEERLNDIVTTSSKIIAAAMEGVDKPDSESDSGIAGAGNRMFGYRKKEL
jgi:hypothetical protein